MRDGVNLMIIGMGTVYAFLILLVYTTRAMSALIARYLPQAIEPVAAELRVTQATTSVHQDNVIAAVTAAAVQHHRNRSR